MKIPVDTNSTLNRAGVDLLNSVGNPRIKHLSDIGLSRLKDHVYQINNQGRANPFHAVREDGQIKWTSKEEVTPSDIEEVIAFSVLVKRSLLINGGTHGKRDGQTVSEDPMLGDTRILAEVAEKIQRQDAFLKVAFHVVSQRCPPLTHTDYPKIDIIDAWCFSSETDARKFSLSEQTKQFAKKIFSDKWISFPRYPDIPISEALSKIYMQERYASFKRRSDGQSFPWEKGFFALDIVLENTVTLGESSKQEQSDNEILNQAESTKTTQYITTHVPLTLLMEPKSTRARHIIIKGTAGTGKSIFLSYLAYQFFHDKVSLGPWASQFKYIVLIPLAKMKALKHQSIGEYLKKEEPNLFENVTAEEIENYIHTHREEILLLLDGYDEVAYTSEVDTLRVYLDEKFHLIVTTRPERLPETNCFNTIKLDLVGFSIESVEAYLRYFLKQGNRERLIEPLLIQIKENEKLASLAGVPFFLELISIYWKLDQVVTVTSLCTNLVEGVFDRWENKPIADQETLTKPLSALINNQDSKKVLCFFTQAAWQASQSGSRYLESENYREFSPPACYLSIGFLKPIGFNRKNPKCEFIHTFIHDFFSALYLAMQLLDQPVKLFFSSVIQKRLDPNIIWLAVGILDHLGATEQKEQLLEELLKDTDPHTTIICVRALEETKFCKVEEIIIRRFMEVAKKHKFSEEEGAILKACHRIYTKESVRIFLRQNPEHIISSFSLKGMATNLSPYKVRASQGDIEACFYLGFYYLKKGEASEALNFFLTAAKQNHLASITYLGVMYANGEGVIPDKTEACRWYRLAAEQGNAHAQANLGGMYYNGEGVTLDKTEACRLYRLAAEHGFGIAQANLAVMYAKGEGVTQDKTVACKWYRLAAEQGHASAQFNLGVMYDKGEGVTQDIPEAFKWYRLAAEQGNAVAQANLGVMYDKGEGVTQDKAEACKWLRLAAEQGLAIAQYILGAMYANGEGVTQNKPEAYKWFSLAADQGDADAQANLGVMYDKGEGVTQDKAEACKWYRLAAEQGHAGAQANLGFLYSKGEGVTQDKTEACKWYRLAAKQGNAAAQKNLGVMYDNGEGVTQDKAEACKWYSLASKQGDATAQGNLGYMYLNGDGIEKDHIKAIGFFEQATAQGSLDAKFGLGYMLRYGLGASQDLERASSLYREIISKDFIEEYRKGRFFYRSKEENDEIAFLIRLTEAGESVTAAHLASSSLNVINLNR